MFEYTDIKTAPAALGPYSQAVMAEIHFASGAIGIDLGQGSSKGEDVQSSAARHKMARSSKANGMTYDNVVKDHLLHPRYGRVQGFQQCMLSISLQKPARCVAITALPAERSAKLKLLQ